jgi:CRISPR type III-B/RAMP module RAMP protein Cmr1
MEAVSPMFLFGAPSNRSADPELRGAPFRGQLRYWYRTINPGLSKEDLEKKEALLFGSTNLGSRVQIHVQPKTSDSVKIGSRYVLPHRNNFSSKAFLEGSIFNLQANLINESYIEPFLKSLALLINLGGIGKRARRGFGSLQTENLQSEAFPERYQKFHNLFSETNFQNIDSLIKHIDKVLKISLPAPIASSAGMSLFPTGAVSAQYPSFQTQSWCVLVCNQEFPNYQNAMRSFWINHLRRNGIRDDYAFGNTRGGRRASPFHLHLSKSAQGIHLVLTAFKAEPNPSTNFWDKHYALFESCLNAYGGRLFVSKEGDTHDS